MISIEQVQIALDTLRSRNDFLRRQIERRKNRDMRAPETKYERPDFVVPELDRVLCNIEREARQFMKLYDL